jgi:hypothetical protein
MTLNFYIHPENINLNWFEKIPLTNDTFHSFFYLFFLPNKLKINFLDNIYYEENLVYSEILSISPQICKNINESDFIIVKPFHFYENLTNSLKKIAKYIEEAIILDKKILLFYGDDDDHIPPNLPKNIILFTAAGFSSCNKNIYGLPTFSKDYFNGYFLEKKSLSISFCGMVNNPIRFKVVEKLINLNYTNFIIRSEWGGYEKEYYQENFGKYFFTVPPEKIKKQQFIENIRNNLYGVCVRGAGNFSYRLGEVLMMGRIPIIIDTNCILPFREYIPYEKNCIIVNYKNLDNMIDVIQNYHNSHTKEELLNIQKENRNIWLKYFTPKGAFGATLKILECNFKNNNINTFNFNYV